MLSYAIVETGVCHSLLYLLLFVFGFAIASPQYCRKDSHGYTQGPDVDERHSQSEDVGNVGDQERSEQKSGSAYGVDHGNACSWCDIRLTSRLAIHYRNDAAHTYTCDEKSHYRDSERSVAE